MASIADGIPQGGQSGGSSYPVLPTKYDLINQPFKAIGGSMDDEWNNFVANQTVQTALAE